MKNEHDALMEGFNEGLTKQALFTAIGSKVLGGLTNVGARLAAKGGRVGEMAGKATQGLVDAAAKRAPGELARNVGIGTVAGAGTLAAGAAGGMAARRR